MKTGRPGQQGTASSEGSPRGGSALLPWALPPPRAPPERRALTLGISVASKRDCLERFGLRTLERITQDDDVICSTEYSRIVPLENGEVGRAGRRGACGLAVSAGTMPLPDLRPSSDRGVLGERAPRCYELLLLAAAA